MVKGPLPTKILKLHKTFRKFRRWVFLLALFPAILSGKTTFAGQSEIDKQYQQAKTLAEFEKIAKKIQNAIFYVEKNCVCKILFFSEINGSRSSTL